MAELARNVADFFVMQDAATHNQFIFHVVDILDMQDADDDHTEIEEINDVYNIAQRLNYTISGNRHFTDTLNLRDYPQSPGLIQQLYQNYTLSQSVTKSNYAFVHTLGLGDSITYARAKGVVDRSLVYTGTVVSRFIKNFHYIDPLTFTNHPVAFISDPNYIAGPVYPIVRHSFVIFSSVDGLYAPVSLRPPDFNNKDSPAQRRIQRETRNGDLIIYRDPTWSNSEVLELAFSFIGKKETRQMENFVAATLGRLVTYRDHEGNTWTGIFNSPSLEVTTPGRFNDSFKVTFEVLNDL